MARRLLMFVDTIDVGRHATPRKREEVINTIDPRIKMFYIEEMTTEQKRRVCERVRSHYLSRLEEPMKTLNLDPSFELSMLPDRKTHGKLRADAFASFKKRSTTHWS
ncbi:unnamed protein product [Zymoseptoria tritici ST99CH_1E4]|uniref:Uncharacterized protein n=1 Tax=Zymoseptoria tritici ST99CH_1E4 TaxID=1276532 RepID=A0A2H1H5N4_ZYMTR|nr:unnamed protein product [Zymoseptoria tritici ST99CH_1E4]